MIPLWRILRQDRADAALSAVQNPEGRFHHDGQRALYAALSAEGAGIAMARYAEDDASRVIVGLALEGGAILDLTKEQDLPTGINAATATGRWDDDRAAERYPDTWVLSDRVRAAGWDGFIYPSRQRPDLKSLVLFRWNEATGPAIRLTEPPAPWP